MSESSSSSTSSSSKSASSNQGKSLITAFELAFKLDEVLRSCKPSNRVVRETLILLCAKHGMTVSDQRNVVAPMTGLPPPAPKRPREEQGKQAKQPPAKREVAAWKRTDEYRLLETQHSKAVEELRKAAPSDKETYHDAVWKIEAQQKLLRAKFVGGVATSYNERVQYHIDELSRVHSPTATHSSSAAMQSDTEEHKNEVSNATSSLQPAAFSPGGTASVGAAPPPTLSSTAPPTALPVVPVRAGTPTNTVATLATRFAVNPSPGPRTRSRSKNR